MSTSGAVVESAQRTGGRAVFVALARASADIITFGIDARLGPTVLCHRHSEQYFPYSLLVPTPGSGGYGLWSRFPLAALSPLNHQSTRTVAARLRRSPVSASTLWWPACTSALPSRTHGKAFGQWRTASPPPRSELDALPYAAVSAVIVAVTSTARRTCASFAICHQRLPRCRRTDRCRLRPDLPSTLLPAAHHYRSRADPSRRRLVDPYHPRARLHHRALLATIQIAQNPALS